jgi:putative copper export protein
MPGSSPPSPALVQIITEVLYYLSLSLPFAIGLTVAALAVPEKSGGVVSRHVRTLALPTAALVAIAAALRSFGPASRGADLGEVAAFVLVIAGLVAMRRCSSRRLAAGVTTVATVVALIPTVPADFSSLNAVVRNVLTAAHVLGAIAWVGGVVILAGAGLMTRRSRLDDSDQYALAARDWSQIWERYSLVALYAVGALVVSGAGLSWMHVGTLTQLVTTAYGRYLTAKLVLVLALVAAGAYNMRVLMPRIRAAEDVRDVRRAFHLAVEHFPAVVVAESVAAVGILFIVPFLRGSARSQAGWPNAGSFDLTTMATGVILVALTAGALWAGTRTPKSAAR